MKKILSLLLCTTLLTGCSSTAPELPPPASETVSAAAPPSAAPVSKKTDYISRYTAVTEIVLSDNGMTVDGSSETDTVFTSNDIIYYENRDSYASGNPYGEGTDADKHTAEEAAAHTVVNITAPGAYRISGKLSAGQIRIDLGDDACDDPNAVVELILEDAAITCTVAPAVLFLNVYECDGDSSKDTAKPDVDTAAAGANLILRGENTVSGSYVAKIYKDKKGEKKLWKQDAAIYSYMSMNVFGPGKLTVFAENEGLDTELHLTVCGGDIAIYAQNDGINTNEDGVSVTTILDGNLHILAGLGEEGDGIDSNGYLVIRGGTVVSAAHPASDAGVDSDMGTFIHGGTVIAFGVAENPIDPNSAQIALNFRFPQPTADTIKIVDENGASVFVFDLAADEHFSQHPRRYTEAVISCPDFRADQTYLPAS